MGVMETFMAYANDFETTYEDNDWSRLRPYFADDAVYEVKNASYACRLEGPDAIFRGIEKSLDGFDRKMDTRTIEVVSPPAVDGDDLSIAWAVIYTLGDAPPLRVEATSRGTVRDGKIVYLADEYDPAQEPALHGWFQAHCPDLDPSYV